MNPWRGLNKLPRELWILSTTTLVNRVGTMALPFLILYLTQSRGLSAGRAGLVVTVYGLGALVTAPLAGRLSDRVGALVIMKSSLFLTGALLFVFPLARSLAAIFVLTFIWAIVSEAFRPASMATIVDLVTPEQRKAGFALHRLAANLGMSIGPAVGGFLATLSFKALFFVDGATAILAGTVLAASRWPVAPAAARAEAKSKAVAGVSNQRRGILTDHAFLWFLAAMLPVVMVFFQYQSSMPLFLVRDLHLTESHYGLLFTINTLMVVLFEVPLNSATAHWPHRLSLALGASLCGIGFGSMTFARGFAGVTAAAVIWTFAEIILFPCAAAYAAEIADPERRGQYMGIFQMTFSLAFVIGPWAGTNLLEHFGARMLWGTTFICSAVSAAMLARVALKHAEVKQEIETELAS
ncbi:MAG TPA: MFS transporter [Blastocatellia bacterium]|nr:MFS transporter [Blastocatellia bacterium]